MGQQEKIINDYLTKAYDGARMMGDEDCMLRLARAMAAFNADTDVDIFRSEYLPMPGE